MNTNDPLYFIWVVKSDEYTEHVDFFPTKELVKASVNLYGWQDTLKLKHEDDNCMIWEDETTSFQVKAYRERINYQPIKL